MAITTVHAPSPFIAGQAANIIGQEQARQRAVAEAMQREQLAFQQQQADVRNQLAQAQMAQQAYQFDAGLQARMVDADRARQASLAADGMRQQGQLNYLSMQGGMQQQRDVFAAQQDAMRQQAGLEEAQMQQQGLNQRQQGQIAGQMQMQRSAHLQQQMTNDWARVQAVLPDLEQSEQEELIANFQQKYSDAGMQPPMEIPEPPEDPFGADAVLRDFKATNPKAPVYRDENGNPALIRGWRPDMDPEYQAQQQAEADKQREFDMGVEQQKGQFEQFKAQTDARMKYQDAMAKAHSEANKIFTIKTQPKGGVGTATEMPDHDKIAKHMQQADIKNRGMFLDPPTSVPIPAHLRAFPWVLDANELKSLPAGSRALMLINGEWQIVIGDGDANSGSGS